MSSLSKTKHPASLTICQPKVIIAGVAVMPAAHSEATTREKPPNQSMIQPNVTDSQHFRGDINGTGVPNPYENPSAHVQSLIMRTSSKQPNHVEEVRLEAETQLNQEIVPSKENTYEDVSPASGGPIQWPQESPVSPVTEQPSATYNYKTESGENKEQQYDGPEMQTNNAQRKVDFEGCGARRKRHENSQQQFPRKDSGNNEPLIQTVGSHVKIAQVSTGIATLEQRAVLEKQTGYASNTTLLGVPLCEEPQETAAGVLDPRDEKNIQKAKVDYQNRYDVDKYVDYRAPEAPTWSSFPDFPQPYFDAVQGNDSCKSPERPLKSSSYPAPGNRTRCCVIL